MARSTPTGFRHIGPLPNLTRMVDKIQRIFQEQVAKKARDSTEPMKVQAETRSTTDMIQSLRDVTRVQDEFNRKIWGQYGSLPAPHAETHMGGDDTVGTNTPPSDVSLGKTDFIGTPQLGYSPGDHVHGTILLSMQVRALVSLRVG